MIKSLSILTHPGPTVPPRASHSHPIQQLPSTHCAQKQVWEQKSLPPLPHTDTLRYSIRFSSSSFHILAYLLSATKNYRHKEASYCHLRSTASGTGSSAELDLIRTVSTQHAQKNFPRKGWSQTGLSQKGPGTHQAHSNHDRLQISRKDI